METIRNVAFCPHCGNRAPQKLIQTHHCVEVDSDGDTPELPQAYFVAVCETCDELLLYYVLQHIPDDKDFTSSHLLWPQATEIHESVPDKVAKIYREALRIRQLAPNAIAAKIRRALEAVCEDRGATKGHLQKRLKELADRGEIPPVLAEMTDTLRALGNVGAHATDHSITSWEVHGIDEFFRAVIEYVYTARSKLKEFLDLSKVFKAKREPKDNGDI